jgi:hypothetical protein
MQKGKTTIRRGAQFILSEIVSLHIYGKAVRTCGIFRNYWGIKVQRR